MIPTPEDLLQWAKSARTMPPKARAELDRMVVRAGSQWNQVVLPQELLALPKPLEALVGTGLSLDVARFSKRKEFEDRSVRRMAMFMDAPLATHELLDRMGEPHEAWEDCSKFCLHLIDRVLVNGAREVEREHPQHMREAMTREVFSVAAARVLDAHHRKNSNKSRELMQWATDLGADWEHDQIQKILKGYATSNKKFDRAAHDALIAELHANRLDAQVAPVSVHAARPRL